MRFTAVAVGAGLLLGLVAGGHIRDMSMRPVRAWALLGAGVAVQLASARMAGAAAVPAVLVSYALLLTFAVANLHLVGMTVVLLGMSANALVIGVNNGMPVRPDAVVAAGLADASQVPRLRADAKTRPERPGDRLTVLADIIPAPMIREVLSFGDLVIGVGVADTIVHLMRGAAERPRTRRRRHDGAPVAVTG
ncbi:MAG TPA: DUF5317 family protein [Acidimicrobiales bacterium]|nr:DUF5317 family protein [Acidimicrobiales bacterium]